MINFFVSLFFIFSNKLPDDLIKMRTHFELMSKSEKNIEAIFKISTESKAVPDQLKKAYYAAAEMSSAQYKFNPISKINTFSSGRTKLDQVILENPTSVEMRYIRFTIQDNAPSFLGYNKNLTSDKLFLIKNIKALKQSDIDLYSKIYVYLLVKANLSEQEKNSLTAQV